MAEQAKIWEHFQNENVESFSGSTPRLDFLIEKIKSLAPSATPRVLNIGIGNGYLEQRCHELKMPVSALDPDLRAVEKLARRGIDAKVGLISKMPFNDGSFDFVVASEVLEHLNSEEARAALQEIQRILDRGGFFLGTVPYAELLSDNQVICPDCGHKFHRWGHQQTFDKATLQALLTQTLGLQDLEVRSFVQFKDRDLRGKIKSAVKWALGRLGEQVASPHLYFLAQKAENDRRD